MPDALDKLLDGVPATSAPAVSGISVPRAPRLAAAAAPRVRAAASPAALSSDWRTLEGFAEGQGFHVTSPTGGRYNSGSAHYAARAVDVRKRDKTPEQIAALDEAARAAGFVARDERTRPPGQSEWSGPHYHLEARTAAPVASGDDLDKVLDAVPAAASADDLDKLLDTVPVVRTAADDDVLTTTSAPRYQQSALPSDPHTLPRLSLPAQPNLETYAGRQQRDLINSESNNADARLIFDVHLPAGARDWSQVDDKGAVRAGVLQYAQTNDIPEGYTRKWLDAHAEQLHFNQNGKPVQPADLIYDGSPHYDFEKRSLRVSAQLPIFKKLRDDYMASLPAADKFGEWLYGSQESFGEKALDACLPVVHGAAKVADVVSRPFSAVDASVWSRVNRPGIINKLEAITNPFDAQAHSAGYDALKGETPADAHNPVASAVRNNATLKATGFDSLAGGITEALTSPSNLVLAGAGKAGMEALKGTRAGAQLAEAMGGGVRLTEFFNRGGRVLDIERAATTGTKAADGLLVTLKDEVGNLSHVNTATGEVTEVKTLPRIMGMTVHEALAKYPKLDEYVAHSLQNAEERAASFEAEAGRADLPDDYRQTHAEEAARAHDEAAYLRDVQAAIEEARTPSAPVEADAPADALDQVIDSVPADEKFPYTKPSLARRAARQFVNAYNLPKSVQASADLSATLRQGLISLAAHPSFIRDVMENQVKAFASQDAADALKDAILNHGDYPLMRDSGLYLSSVRGSAPEEVFSSPWSDKLPIVKQSDRAYSAALDTVRVKSFEMYAAELRAAGVHDEKAFSDIAHWINRATGCGEGKLVDALAPILNVPVFSPRLTASRFQVLNPVFYMKMTPAARRIAVREMMRSTATVSATVGLAALAGAHTSIDPRNANFGKIVVGNTHLDVGAGKLQAVRYMAQMTDAFAREAKGQKVDPKWTPTAITMRFMRSKLGPLPSYAVDVVTGKDYSGQPVEWKRRAAQMAVPFVVSDLYEGWKDSGAWGALKASPSILGIGVQTYKRGGFGDGGRFNKGRSHSYTNSDPVEDASTNARP